MQGRLLDLDPSERPLDRRDADPAAPAGAWRALVRAAGTLDRALRRVEGAAMVLSALSIAAIAALVCAEVVARGMLGVSTLIATEAAGYLLAANVYLGLAWTFRNGGFIRVDLVQGQMRGRLLAGATLVMAALSAAVLAVYAYHLHLHVAMTFRSGATSVFVTRTPLWIPMTVMPLGAGLLTLGMVAHALRAAGALILDRPDLLRPEGADEPEAFL